jgi:hypothetical protein
MKIGVTGHADLGRPTAQLVHSALADALRPYAGPELVGISCLCRGADQIFADAVLAAQGRLDVILPAADYRHRVVRDTEMAVFDDLLGKAGSVRHAAEASGRRAYASASRMLVEECDMLFAVWDGTPSRRMGDTADVVRAALESGVDVQVIWPDRATRPAHSSSDS